MAPKAPQLAQQPEVQAHWSAATTLVQARLLELQSASHHSHTDLRQTVRR